MFIENCLTTHECGVLEKKFLQYIKNENLSREINDDITISDKMFYCNGLLHPFRKLQLNADHVIQRLTAFAKNIYGEKISYAHSYMRIYYNGSELKLHTDRDPLDITLTINVAGLENWKIYYSRMHTTECITYTNDTPFHDHLMKYKKFVDESYSIETPRGSGYIKEGKYPHWRYPLHCADNEYVMQIFFHWKFIN